MVKDESPHGFSEGSVEVGEGFIEEESLWFCEECAGKGDAGSLSAGESGGVFEVEVGEFNGGEGLFDDRFSFFSGGIGGYGVEKVFGNREVGKEEIILEEDAYISFIGREVLDGFSVE